MNALASPLRRRILRSFSKEVRSPLQLSVAMQESLGVISYHVRILHKSKLIRRNGQRKVRGAIEHFYEPVESTLPLLDRLESAIHEHRS